MVNLGGFATNPRGGGAVRHVRSPEGRVAAKWVASAPPPRMSDEEGQGKHPSMPSRAVLKEEGTVPPMPLGAFVKEEEIPRQAPSSNIKEEVVVKREHGARADRRRGSGRTIIVLYKKGCHFSGGSGGGSPKSPPNILPAPQSW